MLEGSCGFGKSLQRAAGVGDGEGGNIFFESVNGKGPGQFFELLGVSGGVAVPCRLVFEVTNRAQHCGGVPSLGADE